jgi:medium-chain acyl-[acyl-carrier-protein] hydrolase
MSRVWTGPFPVHTYELDPTKRVSVPALAGFLQEAAGHSAHARGYSVHQLLEQNLTWVLSRLRIRLRELPGWKAQLTVQTWPSGLDRLFALRDFRILSEEREIGAAVSAWLMLDVRNRRLVRPESFLDWQDVIHPERSLAVELDKLPGVEGGGPPLQERELPVRYSDLDINLHASNTCYVAWLLEAVPLEILRARRLAELDVDFLAEASHGERILSRAYDAERAAGGEPRSPDGVRAFRHTLLRLVDGREVARARSVWV